MREPGSNDWISLAPSLNNQSGPHSRLLKLGMSLNYWISFAPLLNSRSGPRSRYLNSEGSLSDWILLAPLLNNRSGPCSKVVRWFLIFSIIIILSFYSTSVLSHTWRKVLFCHSKSY